MTDKKITSKKFYRSESNRMVAGVCGGIGEYLHLDPTIIRLFWIFFTLVGGSGILVYVILWVVVPSESNVKQNS